MYLIDSDVLIDAKKLARSNLPGDHQLCEQAGSAVDGSLAPCHVNDVRWPGWLWSGSSLAVVVQVERCPRSFQPLMNRGWS